MLHEASKAVSYAIDCGALNGMTEAILHRGDEKLPEVEVGLRLRRRIYRTEQRTGRVQQEIEPVLGNPIFVLCQVPKATAEKGRERRG